MKRNILIRGMFLFGALFLVLSFYRVREYCSTSFTRGRSGGGEFNCETSVSISELMKGPIPQDDWRILQFIQSQTHFLQRPSTEPYNLTKPNVDPSMGQSSVVRRIFKNMTGGFFVECGALDGETRSNTLDLEKQLGWQGLLIEADPSNFELVAGKHRKAWISNTCLATKPYPHEVFFKPNFNTGRIANDEIGRRANISNQQIRVQCFPIFSLLSAMNVKTVDYFSLDVEGHEYQVLLTIPFDQINIKVLSVEYIHDKEGSQEIEDFMRGKGYRVVTKVTNGNNLANDLIFAHKTVIISENIPPVRT